MHRKSECIWEQKARELQATLDAERQQVDRLIVSLRRWFDNLPTPAEFAGKVTDCKDWGGIVDLGPGPGRLYWTDKLPVIDWDRGGEKVFPVAESTDICAGEMVFIDDAGEAIGTKAIRGQSDT